VTNGIVIRGATSPRIISVLTEKVANIFSRPQGYTQ